MATASAADSTAAASMSGKITWEEKFEQAKSFKRDGNEQYKAGKIKAAVSKYHRALLYLKGIESSQQPLPFYNNAPGSTMSSIEKVPAEVLEEVTKLKMDCYNNLAACLLQMEQPSYEKVEVYSDNVLEISPLNLKALYRKGVALFHMKKVDEALRVLGRAARLPNGDKDSNIKKYLRLCDRELTEEESKVKDTYRAMFNPQSVADVTTANGTGT